MVKKKISLNGYYVRYGGMVGGITRQTASFNYYYGVGKSEQPWRGSIPVPYYVLCSSRSRIIINHQLRVPAYLIGPFHPSHTRMEPWML